ncbi:MAG: hypothetical protein LBK50_02965 [Candidatus Nomurabacteria bacterium]|jgi:hypothetical protein|nr:hypothetical protein [Candidatus Nomurabacteria bacterium]
MTQKYKSGVFYSPKVNIWPHEKVTAKTLADAGYYVEFRPASNRKGEHSADCYLNGELWELKAPNGKTLKSVERNLKRGKWQSSRIVFDTHRMKRVPDGAIKREIRSKIDNITEIEIVKFIGRRKDIVDISKTV